MEITTQKTTTTTYYHAIQVLWYLFDLLEILLLFRFILKFLDANPSAGFTSFIYSTTYPFAQPFLNVFSSSRLDYSGTFEWTTLLAMFIYWLVMLGIMRLLNISKRHSSTVIVQKQ